MPVAPRTPTKQSPGHRGLAELDRMAKRGVGEKELSATKKLFGGPLLTVTPALALRYKGKADKVKVGAFRKDLSL